MITFNKHLIFYVTDNELDKYKAIDLFKFKYDEENSIWKFDSVENVFHNNGAEYAPYNS